MAQGTRSSIERLRDSRLTFSRGFNLLLNLAFRTWATDSKSGFVLAPTPVMKDVVSYRGPYRYFQTFISVAAKAKGYSVLRGRDAIPEPLRRHIVPVGPHGQRLARRPRRLSARHSEFGLRRHPHGASIGPRTSPPEGRQHPYRGWRRLWFEAYFATMPLHAWRIGRRARELYLELKRSEWYSRDALDELQLRKLQRLVQHAYVHVPALPRCDADGGRRAGRHQVLEDIARLPLLSKTGRPPRALLRPLRRQPQQEANAANLHERLDRRAVRDVRRPVSARVPMRDDAPRAGVDRLAVRRPPGPSLAPDDRHEKARGGARAHRRHGSAPAVRPGVRDGAGRTLEEFVRKIREHRPVLVDGYAESFNFLARYATEGGKPGFSPKAIMSSAQTLPESSRDAIEEAFGARVFDKYGSREFSGIAYECPSRATTT